VVTLHGRTLAALDTASFITVPGRVAAGSNATGGTIGIGFPVALAALAIGAGLVALRRRLATRTG
jgi:hypothetical protein